MLPTALSNGEVIILVVIVALPIAAIAFSGAGAVYRQIGKGQFSMTHDISSGPRPTAPPASRASRQEQEAEIRQMLEAKAFRQAQRGERTIDIDAEMERLLAPAATPPSGTDPSLLAEVRQLVVARNERRLRRGEEPLDVEAEVTRRLRELENLGQ